MYKWLENLSESKKAFPLLSFPSISLLGVSVKEMVTNSDAQAKGMALVAQKTDSAAAVSFMDLSVEAECFGAEINFFDDEVPNVAGRLINDKNDADALAVAKVGSARSGIYIDAVRKAVKMITDRPVFAGIIGPYSLAARLFDVSEIMMDCYDDPDMVHTVLEKVTEFLTEYSKAYKAAGAHGIVMAEPVAGLLSPSMQDEFSATYVKRIVDAVQDESFLVVYHNCGNNTPFMTESLISIGAAAYHFGNAVDMKEMLEKFPENITVMGNVDPVGVLCNGTPETVFEKTSDIMNKCAIHKNFVISSGCDVPHFAPWNNINAFFDAVSKFNK